CSSDLVRDPPHLGIALNDVSCTSISLPVWSRTLRPFQYPFVTRPTTVPFLPLWSPLIISTAYWFASGSKSTAAEPFVCDDVAGRCGFVTTDPPPSSSSRRPKNSSLSERMKCPLPSSCIELASSTVSQRSWTQLTHTYSVIASDWPYFCAKCPTTSFTNSGLSTSW